jgi:AraC-like DNA-binding protein
MITPTRTEYTKFWHTRELGSQFEMLRATYYAHTFARHVHEGYVVGVIEHGGETFEYRGEMITALAGDVVVLNPDEMHTGQAAGADGWMYRVLYPGADLLQRAATELAGSPQGMPYFPSPVIHDAALYESIRQLHIAIEESPLLMERETRLLWTLAELISRHASWRPEPKRARVDERVITQAKAYIDEHYGENIALETLAATVHMSAFHFSRMFRERVGLPPHTYLTQVRINHAKTLLDDGLPPVEVALATGFAQQSHLNRAFKRIVGVTPGQYRKNRQDTAGTLW